MVMKKEDMVLNTYFLLETLKEEKVCERERLKEKMMEKRKELTKKGKFYPIDFVKDPNNGSIKSNVFNELVFMNRGLEYFDTVTKRMGYINLKESNLEVLDKIEEDGEYFVFTKESQDFLDEYNQEAENMLKKYNKELNKNQINFLKT